RRRAWARSRAAVRGGGGPPPRRYPIATKRILRALLKANDLCAREPERMARRLAERNPAVRFEHALQMLRELSYGRWRQYNAEDTMRFYALRLHEAGLVRSSPRKLIADG